LEHWQGNTEFSFFALIRKVFNPVEDPMGEGLELREKFTGEGDKEGKGGEPHVFYD
jgi:hypothetical protein